MRSGLLIFTAVLLLTSCKQNNNPSSLDKDDIVLASYKDQKLYQQDAFDALGTGLIDADTALLLSGYTDRWLKDRIIINAASSKLNNLQEINAMVDDYKESLLLYHSELALLNEKVDTVISEEELNNYYQSNKAEYKLESTIIKCLFVKANKPLQDKRDFELLWKSPTGPQLLQLQRFCENDASKCFLQQDNWVRWSDLKQFLPAKSVSESALSKGLNRSFADFNHEYYLRIFDIVKPNQDPPMSFIKDKATKAILYQRKSKSIESIRKSLYDKALTEKQIEIFK